MRREERVRELGREPEFMLSAADARIAWVLEHPRMSDWLKQALRTAEGLDLIGLRNDVEILKHLIASRSEAPIEVTLTPLSVK